MSNFVVNRQGLDQVTFEMTTTGRSEGSINLKEALLGESFEYVFCVDSLNVPLNSVPITTTTDQVLFQVIRRNATVSLDVALNTVLLEELYVYTLDRSFYDVASFVRSLNNWARGVEYEISLTGIDDFRQYGGDSLAANADASVVPPLRELDARTEDEIVQFGLHDMIKFRLGADGSLVIDMSTDFTNNFVLQFTRYGAEVLGIGNKISAVTHNVITQDDDGNDVVNPPTTDYYLAVTTEYGVPVYTAESWLEVDALVGPHKIKPGNNNRETSIYSEHSLYMTMDQRVKISLSSHLPMLNNLLVKEGKETVDRNIVEVFFTNRVTSSVTFDDDGIFKEQTITNTLYAGMYPFIKKSDRSKQWHKLLTSYNLRFLRFAIQITYRNYDSKKDAWVFKTTALKIDKSKYWDFSLRFLSLV